MKIIILLGLSLSWAAVQVSCNKAFLGYLLNQKATLVTQMEKQIEGARSFASVTASGELVKFIADIDEANKFARDETTMFAQLYGDTTNPCLNLAISQIILSSEQLVNDCVQSVIADSEGVDLRQLEAFEAYRSSANDINLLFARDYFKQPEKVLTPSLFNEVWAATRQRAILWDNVESMDLYKMRRELSMQLTTTDNVLYKCIMDMKGFVGTEIGRYFLFGIPDC